MEIEIQIGNIYKFKLIEKTQLSNGYIVVRIQSFTLFLTTVIVSDFWVYRSNSELGFWRLCSSVEGSPDKMYKGDPDIYNYDYIQTTFIHLTLQFFINSRFGAIPLIGDISIDEITNGMDIDNDENIQKIERHKLLPFKQSGKLFVLSNPLTSSYKSIVDSKHPPTKKNRSIEEDPFKQLYDEAKCGEELDVNSLKQFSDIFKDTYEVITDLPVDGGKYNYEFEEIIRVNGQINCITLHLFTFQTPIFTAKKIKKHKINSRNFTYDGLTFSSSVFILEEVKDEI
jgi:hypothetical protein